MLLQVVSDLIFELFITFCIVLNVLTMAIEYHGMSGGLELGLRIANYVSILCMESTSEVKLFIVIDCIHIQVCTSCHPF